MNEPLLYRLRNGRGVMGKRDCEGLLRPITYANLTQARTKARQLGQGWSVIGFRPFYVAKDSTQAR